MEHWHHLVPPDPELIVSPERDRKGVEAVKAAARDVIAEAEICGCTRTLDAPELA